MRKLLLATLFAAIGASAFAALPEPVARIAADKGIPEDAIGALVLCAATPPTFAQSFDGKPIRFVVGFPPGGPTDFTARLLAEKMPALLGTNAIVENRAGANATIAADHVARSAPDGHTLYFSTCGALAISPHIGPKLPYEPLRDFAPIGQVVNASSTVAVHPSLPVKNVKEFAVLARTRKGQVTLATSGVGSIPHLAYHLGAIRQLAQAASGPPATA